LLSRLLLLFIVVPIIELFLLIQIGQWIGTLPTIGIILVTGTLGAFLARRQGIHVLNRVQAEFQRGQLPADAISDGAIILVAAALLVTPGILTDAVGFMCLIPYTRRFIKQIIRRQFENAVQHGQVYTSGQFYGQSQPYIEPDDVLIIDHDDISSTGGR
jgi:UPF0716 protein FxsA